MTDFFTDKEVVETLIRDSTVVLKINLKDEVVFESKAEPEIPDAEGDNYVEDETLPFPEFDIEEPAINSKNADS